jgi:type II secretion system protein N
MKRPVRFRQKEQPVTSGRRTLPGLFLLGAAGLFLLSLLTGIYLFFPAETLKQRISREAAMRAKIDLQIESLSLSPLLTFDADRLSVTAEELPWPLEIEALKIAPAWMTWFSGDPGIRLEARLMGGTVTSSLRKSGTVSAQAADLSFDLPIRDPLTFRIAGTLVAADLDTQTRLDRETPTRISLRLNQVRIIGLDLSGAGGTDINLGEITLLVTGQGRDMQIDSLSAKGGDFDVEGDGAVMIGRTAAASRLRITLRVRPGSSLDPDIASLLELAGKPGPDGRYPLQVTGSLAKPSLKIGG